jgi:hypothetical protein
MRSPISEKVYVFPVLIDLIQSRFQLSSLIYAMLVIASAIKNLVFECITALSSG